jgi:hypothetical protein
VPPRSLDRDPEPEEALLGDRDREDRVAVEEGVADPHPALVDDVRAPEPLPVVLDEVPHPAVADLLVRDGEEEDVAAQRDPEPLEPREDEELDDAEPLHVERAPPPHVPLLVDRPRQRPLPLGPPFLLGGGDVDVGEQAERGLLAAAAQPRDERAPPGRVLEDLVLDPLRLEEPREVARPLGLVPGGVAGVHLQVAREEPRRLVAGGGEVEPLEEGGKGH